MNNNKFIRDLPFEQRVETINDLKQKYPDRAPLMITDEYRKMKPIKLLIPFDLTVMNLLCIIRKRVELGPEENIYIFINVYANPNNNKIKESILCSSSESIATIYNKYKDQDGMLYMTYCKENTFG